MLSHTSQAPDKPEECHECGYSLRGLAQPRRCPECGTSELPARIAVNGIIAQRWLRIAIIGPFVRGTLVSALWHAALFRLVSRRARVRPLLVLVSLLIHVLTAIVLSGFWTHRFPSSVSESGYVQRCWWYEVHRQLPMHMSLLIAPWPARDIWYLYRWPGLSLSSIGDVHYLVLRHFVPGWLFLVVVWPALCSFLFRVRMSRAIHVGMLLLASFLPFLCLGLMLLISKLAYMFFLVDEEVIAIMAYLHVVGAIWPGIVFSRYSGAGTSFWRSGMCVVVTFTVTVVWPLFGLRGWLFSPEFALNWV